MQKQDSALKKDATPVKRPTLKKGQELELTVEKVADRGKALTRVDGYVVFIRGGVPGDRLRVLITRSKRKFAEARIIEILEPSSDRVEPRCVHFGSCGGCKWQQLDYTAQLEAKRQNVEDALHREGGLEHVVVRDVIGSDPIYRYRNKMEFSFSAERWLTSEEIESGRKFDRTFALGLHAPGNFARVLDLTECHLHSEEGERLVNGFRALTLENGWEPWNIRRHTGFLRHLVLRKSAHTADFMVNLVTNGFDEERIALVQKFLESEYPEVSTLVNTINTGKAQTAFGEEIRVIYGPGTITDRIGRFEYEIASNAFFQTNTFQAEKLYDVALEYAEIKPTDTVFDLYSGAGTISIHMAEHAKKVIGVELIEEATQNARENAIRNKVDNTQFITGDMMKLFGPEFIEEHGRPDVLVVDPPRAGMHPRVVKQISRLKVDRMVYVSCNPQSQARDLKELSAAYEVLDCQPVDLFPHTHHIENVVKLRARVD